jgi:hypothetical protein
MRYVECHAGFNRISLPNFVSNAGYNYSKLLGGPQVLLSIVTV